MSGKQTEENVLSSVSVLRPGDLIQVESYLGVVSKSQAVVGGSTYDWHSAPYGSLPAYEVQWSGPNPLRTAWWSRDELTLVKLGPLHAESQPGSDCDSRTQESYKHQTKKSREVHVIESDRVSLITQANKLIESISFKMVVPYLAMPSVPVEPIALDGAERKAYDAALEYLARQFTSGHVGSEVVDKRIENEESTETSVK